MHGCYTNWVCSKRRNKEDLYFSYNDIKIIKVKPLKYDNKK